MTMDGRAKSEPILTAANTAATASGTGAQQQHQCAGCGKAIADRFLLRALDMFWHEDCLKCGCCDCRLGEVGSTLYTKSNLMLCKRDYLRLFGNTGLCAACNKMIPAFEMVMRARANVYHLECFACQQCNHRFCVGDRFYLCENKILCEYDYEERLVFASIGNHPMLKRHANNMSSAGGGSPNPSHGHSHHPSPTAHPTHQQHHPVHSHPHAAFGGANIKTPAPLPPGSAGGGSASPHVPLLGGGGGLCSPKHQLHHATHLHLPDDLNNNNNSNKSSNNQPAAQSQSATNGQQQQQLLTAAAMF